MQYATLSAGRVKFRVIFFPSVQTGSSARPPGSDALFGCGHGPAGNFFSIPLRVPEFPAAVAPRVPKNGTPAVMEVGRSAGLFQTGFRLFFSRRAAQLLEIQVCSSVVQSSKKATLPDGFILISFPAGLFTLALVGNGKFFSATGTAAGNHSPSVGG